MLHSARQSLHFCLHPTDEIITVTGTAGSVFYVVSPEMVGGEFCELGMRCSDTGGFNFSLECKAVTTAGTLIILANIDVGNWTYFKKTNVCISPNYRLSLGDRIYVRIWQCGTSATNPVRGCSAYVTFK